MNPFKYFWNHPYPESVMWPIVQGFRSIASYMEKNPISNRKYRIQCVVISAVAFLALFLLTGTKNPFEFFVDIPIYDLVEFNRNVGGDEYALYTYMFSSAIFVAVGIYLIRLFLFHAREDRFFSVNGIFFFVMSVFISALISIPVQRLSYAFSSSFLLDIEAMQTAGCIILGFALNFALYFAMQDSFSAILSSAVGVELIMIFQERFQQFIPNRFVLLLLVSLILRVLLEVLDLIGMWRPIVDFCAKWFYTPRYVIKLTFFIITILLFLLSRGDDKGKKRDGK